MNSLDKLHPIQDLRLELSELQIIKDRKLLTYQGKIYIPAPAISNVLLALHEGHEGYDRCLAAAKQTMFWPSMTKDIQHQVDKCDPCAEFSNIRKTSTPTLAIHGGRLYSEN